METSALGTPNSGARCKRRNEFEGRTADYIGVTGNSFISFLLAKNDELVINMKSLILRALYKQNKSAKRIVYSEIQA